MKRKETIAFQGERGAFSQQLCGAFLEIKRPCRPAKDFEQVYWLYARSRNRAAIPIENTLMAP